jgi:DNA-binding MarR family transcriptional regulator
VLKHSGVNAASSLMGLDAPLVMGTPPFPSMDDLSDDEEAILRFLHDQLLQQASYAQVTHNSSYLRAQMNEDADAAVREILERLADRGYVERRTGRFGAGEARTYAYRLTDEGDQALAAS